MHRPTLSQARTAQLCAELHTLRLRALAQPDGENSYAGVATLQIGLEHALCCLVHELGGHDAGNAVQQALSADISPDAVTAYKAQAAARQAAYLARAATPTKEQTRAHYELQAALATFHGHGLPA